jgi:hypothetical protein
MEVHTRFVNVDKQLDCIEVEMGINNVGKQILKRTAAIG